MALARHSCKGYDLHLKRYRSPSQQIISYIDIERYKSCLWVRTRKKLHERTTTGSEEDPIETYTHHQLPPSSDCLQLMKHPVDLEQPPGGLWALVHGTPSHQLSAFQALLWLPTLVTCRRTVIECEVPQLSRRQKSKSCHRLHQRIIKVAPPRCSPKSSFQPIISRLASATALNSRPCPYTPDHPSADQ